MLVTKLYQALEGGRSNESDFRFPTHIESKMIDSYEELALNEKIKRVFSNSKHNAFYFQYASLQPKTKEEIDKITELAEIMAKHSNVTISIDAHVGWAAPNQSAIWYGMSRGIFCAAHLLKSLNYFDLDEISQEKLRKRVKIRNWGKQISEAGHWVNDEDTARCEIFIVLKKLTVNGIAFECPLRSKDYLGVELNHLAQVSIDDIDMTKFPTKYSLEFPS